MTFTDNDLKRFRDDKVYSENKIPALLARLEAAEAFIWDHKDSALHDKLLEVWRKAAGKP